MAGNLVNPLSSLYGTEWRERGYGLWGTQATVSIMEYLISMELLNVDGSSARESIGKDEVEVRARESKVSTG